MFGQFDEQRGAEIGGSASYFAVDSRMQFSDEAGWPVTYVHPLLIAQPTEGNWEFPSFLGMDFLTYFDIHLNHPKNIVTLDFITDVQ